MISEKDFIQLPYTSDLSQAGARFACSSLQGGLDGRGSPFKRLRRTAAGVAAEVSFRRYLVKQDVRYQSESFTPFSAPDRSQLSLGGRRCHFFNSLIYQKDKISRIKHRPLDLLSTEALVPLDPLVHENPSEGDIFIFTYVLGLVTLDEADLHKAQAAGLPHFMIHPISPAWAVPSGWASLGKVVLKSEHPVRINLELGGLGSDRRCLQEVVGLNPLELNAARQDFFSLTYLHSDKVLTARLGLRSVGLQELRLVYPPDWCNLWIYGMDILVTGYITHGEYRRQSHLLQPGSPTFIYPHTKTKNLSLPVAGLRPVRELVQAAHEWQDSQS
jgi:hypothetical protein